MVDPYNITNYNLSTAQLEEVLLFWVCAAGKNAKSTALGLERFLRQAAELNRSTLFPPFQQIRRLMIRGTDLSEMIRMCGLGCYNNRAKTFKQLANARLDLRTCSVDDLDDIHGIGPKTARCFIIHSRPNQRYCGLDTHILAWLRDMGYDAPKSTPSRKKYLELEQVFLRICDEKQVTAAKLDLDIWRQYSARKGKRGDKSKVSSADE